MDCSKMDDYFMKYMDNTLSKDEAKKLNQHLYSCDICKQDFLVYDELMKDFAGCELFEAPEDLEQRIMAEIATLEPIHVKVSKGKDKVFAFIVATFSIIIGLAFILFINQDAILQLLSQYPQFSTYVSMLAPVSEFASNLITNVAAIITSKVSAAVILLNTYKYVVLVVSLALFGIQVALYKKEKGKVEE